MGNGVPDERRAERRDRAEVSADAGGIAGRAGWAGDTGADFLVHAAKRFKAEEAFPDVYLDERMKVFLGVLYEK